MAGNSRPTNLSKYRTAATASDVAMISSDEDVNYANLMITNKAKSFHKSLDFSNVGQPVAGAGNSRLRQFHQTRLYIKDYGGMIHHGKIDKANSQETYLISANLPEQFSYTIGSKWAQPLAAFSNANVNMLMQMGGHDILNNIGNSEIANKFGVGGNWGDSVQSMNNRVASFYAWEGSEPLKLSLQIPVIDDGHPNGDAGSSTGLHTNFVEALEFLGSLCLPKSGAGKLGFYQPPPSPYEGDFEIFNTNLKLSANKAHIMLQLGGILLVDNIIIEKISVTYPNTKTMIRHWYKGDTNPGYTNQGNSTYLTPLLAMLTINLTTAEALTAQTYSNMLWLKQQSDQGKITNSKNTNLSQDPKFKLSNIDKKGAGNLAMMASSVINGINLG